MTEKVIALVDGSLYSRSVCDHSAWIASRTGAPTELVHVMPRPDASENKDLSGSIQLGARTALLEELADLDAKRAKLLSQQGRAILEDARAILDEAGINEITTRLRNEDILETVAQVEPGARVIVIGKRGEAADFATGHLGSNLERIVRTAKVPVFVASRAFKPIEKVLVAFDGGASSSKALDLIARSPVFKGLPVTLVSVGQRTADIEQKLKAAGDQVSKAGLSTETRIMDGQPEKVLADLVEEEGFGLLVMGAYGHSRIRNFIIGSTTTEMVRSCKVPVVMIR